MIPTEDLPYVTEEITTYEEERRRKSQKDNSHQKDMQQFGSTQKDDL